MKGNRIAQSAFTCGSKIQYSAGEHNTQTISILPVAGSRPRPVTEFSRTITHEFGHLFGLFDSYKMPPRVSFEGPTPHAIMAYTSDRVTRDDAEGIAVAMRWVYEGKIDCGPHTRATNSGTYQKILYCETNPSKSLRSFHRDGLPAPRDAKIQEGGESKRSEDSFSSPQRQPIS